MARGLQIDVSKLNTELVRIARLIAGSDKLGMGWGDINNQDKIRGKNVWYFSCAGHGGYVAFVVACKKNNPIIPEGYNETYSWDDGAIKAYVFEEDCDWAVLEHYNRDIMLWSMTQRTRKLTETEMEYSVVRGMIPYNEKYIKPEYELVVKWMKEDNAKKCMAITAGK
jgi:hypothetical protein